MVEDTQTTSNNEWSYLDKSEKKYAIREIGLLNIERFGEVVVITRAYIFEIQWRIEPQEVSCETTCAAYLVFKLPQDKSSFEAPIQVEGEDASYYRRYSFIYLVSPPQTPIIGPKLDENTYSPLNKFKGNAIPQQRSDGWMEVKVWQFETKTTTKIVPLHLKFEHPDEKDLKGLMIQGIELRPI